MFWCETLWKIHFPPLLLLNTAAKTAMNTTVEPPSNKRTIRHTTSFSSLNQDILCLVFSFLDLFDLVRCLAVSKSWNAIVSGTKMSEARYCRQHLRIPSTLSLSNGSDQEMFSTVHIQKLAMNCHKLSLQDSFVEIFKWKGHSFGVDKCRMKARMILTGGGDKVMRLWSADTYNCLREYSLPDGDPLVDFDFDENKIVGLVGTRICIWNHHLKENVFSSHRGLFTKASCMRYRDSEAVIGCGDGTARVFDMYSGKFSRIIKMQGWPLTCLALNDDHLIISGSSIGTVALSDTSSDQKRVSTIWSPHHREGIKTLCFNPNSRMVFGGSAGGHVYCWDFRMMRSLWDIRVSSKVISTMHHLRGDKSTLVVGGTDGILRILDQDTGEVLSGCIANVRTKYQNLNLLEDSEGILSRTQGRRMSGYTCPDLIPRFSHPPITSLAVGMQKVVTMHNDGFIRIWKFDGSCK